MAAPNQEAAAVLETLIKEKFTIYSEATGDLNNDGLVDWVGIVLTEKPSDTVAQLYVLVQKNGFKLSEKSMGVSFGDCAGHCGPEIFPIKNGSFYIHQSTAYGGGMSYATTQFKLYKNIWRAIGVDQGGISDVEKGTMHSINTNMLTGSYISTEEHITSKGVIKKTTQSGTVKPELLLLRDFDLGTF